MENTMDETSRRDLPYVVFRLGELKYAISSEYVLHIEVLDGVTPMADMDANCRGIVLFNDVSVPVIDLKMMFGVEDEFAELETIMQQRIEDHRLWVEELERSVEEGREFTLATDPHKCALGRWLDNFQTENTYLNMILRGLDDPHGAVHKTGITVTALVREGRKEEAKAEIAKMKATDYVKTIEILSGVAHTIRENMREMMVVLQIGEELKGIVVESITDIKELKDLCAVPKNMERSRFIEQIARDTKETGEIELVQMINPLEL